MSTTQTVKKHKFFVYAPDKTEEGTRARIYEVRPRHLKYVTPLIESGTLKVGGILVPPDAIESDEVSKKAVGSLLIIEAETMDEVKKLIESDAYYTSGVWDSEKIIILPFLPATPFP